LDSRFEFDRAKFIKITLAEIDSLPSPVSCEQWQSPFVIARLLQLDFPNLANLPPNITGTANFMCYTIRVSMEWIASKQVTPILHPLRIALRFPAFFHCFAPGFHYPFRLL